MKILLIFTLQHYNIIFILFYLKYNFKCTSNKFVNNKHIINNILKKIKN